ncbi:MAG: peroxiredoxin [Sterolibacterium sp.]|nr:peroxiredoxin [Sterolibacterium sp.]
MIDQPVADFTLDATGGQPFQLSAARGAPLVIYFYPKDNTPGCTTEASQFRDLHPAFSQLGCTIVGISRDSLKSHETFKAKLGLPFDLLSDTAELACARFDVIKQKKLYGKTVRGIERSTFLLDSQGVLRREWRGVKVADHAAEVLDAVRNLQAR